MSYNNDINIWVLSHKDGDDLFNYEDIHKHIHIGAAINKETSYEYRDDINDNILLKNITHCELTGQYWVWKNMPPIDIVGFEHYRRHFNIPQERIREILNEKDIIVPKRLNEGISVGNHYASCHSLHDIECVEEIIKAKYPDYVNSWNKYIKQPGFLYSCNMFISKYEVFERMMEFTFGILNEFEKTNNLNNIEDYKTHVLAHAKHNSPNNAKWEDYQMRLCGFLAERLNTLWIRHNISPEKIEEVNIETSTNFIKSNQFEELVNKPKKAIILCMSCNKDRYINDEEIIRETWGKDIIDGKYENLSIYFYRGGAEKEYLDEEKHIIHLTSGDELNDTLVKSMDAFKWLKNKGLEFDYIIRTNTSTYINVNAILDFLKRGQTTQKVYGPCINISPSSYGIPYLPGYFLILGKDIVNIFYECKYHDKCVDDVGFGLLLYKLFNRQYMANIVHQVDGYYGVDGLNDDILSKSYFVRCKEVGTEAMREIHKMYCGLNDYTNASLPHNFTLIDTVAGYIPV